MVLYVFMTILAHCELARNCVKHSDY